MWHPPPPPPPWVEIGRLWRGLGYADPTDDVQAYVVNAWKRGTRQNYGSHLRRFGFFHGTITSKETQKVAQDVLILLFKSGYRPTTLRGAVLALRAVHPLGMFGNLGMRPPMAVGQSASGFQRGTGLHRTSCFTDNG